MASTSAPQKGKNSMLLALDLEWYDQTDGNHLKEVGLAIRRPSMEMKYLHYSAKEHLSLVNRYCKTSPLGFIFGTTQILLLSRILLELNFWLQGGDDEANVTLIWHNGMHDRRILKTNGIDLNKFKCRVVDTGDIFQKLIGAKQKSSLEKMTVALNVPTRAAAFHNAGNDAAYTMHSYLAMSEGASEQK